MHVLDHSEGGVKLQTFRTCCLFILFVHQFLVNDAPGSTTRSLRCSRRSQPVAVEQILDFSANYS